MNLKSILRTPFRYRYYHATLFIIALNVLVFFLCNATGLANKTFMIPGHYFQNPFYRQFQYIQVPFMDFTFGLNVWGFFTQHMIWQPVTYMFMHGSLNHLFFNMLGLLFFGITVERALGSREFLLFYFVTGILSGIFSVMFFKYTGSADSVLVGASGALYGVLLLYAVVFPRSVIYVWGLIPVAAPVLVAVYAVIEFLSQFGSSDNVAHMTHLAGFAVAWLYLLVRMGVNPIKVWKNR